MKRRNFLKSSIIASVSFLLGFSIGDKKIFGEGNKPSNNDNGESSNQVNVSKFNAVGDGTDETRKIQSAVNYAYDNNIRDVYFPPPQKKYSIESLEEKGRNFIFEGDYFAGDWRPQTLVDLQRTEGFDKDKYSFVRSFSQKVTDSTKRWWTIISTVFVPKGYGIGQDNAAIRGQAVTEQEQSRIWGGVLLSQANKESAPADGDKQKLPSVIGLEVDVNNMTGYDIKDLEWSEIMGILIASGGTNQVGQALTFSKLPKSKGFWVGNLLKDKSIDFAGTLIDDVDTEYGIYYTKSYLDGKDGGTVISIPSNDNKNNPRKRSLIEIRTDDDKPIKLRNDGNTLFLDLGEGGFHITRDSAKKVMASFNENGEFYSDDLRYSRMGKNLIKISSGQSYIDCQSGSFFQINNSGPTKISEIRNGVIGQEVTICVKDNNTTFLNSKSILLSGESNYNPKRNTIICFIYDGITWYEKSRSENV